MLHHPQLTPACIERLISLSSVLYPSGYLRPLGLLRKPNKKLSKFFCAQHLQRVVNTFPPVWTFTATNYLFEAKANPDEFDLFLVGTFMEKSHLKYFLGTVTFPFKESQHV